jgi:hypothetical protein
MKITFKRSAMVVATVLACLTMFQAPASATLHTYYMDITDGTVTLTRSSVTPAVMSLAPTATTFWCWTGTTIVNYDDVAGTVDIVALDTTNTFTFGAGSFIVDITRIWSTAGTISSTSVPHPITAASVRVNVDIYTNTVPTGCSKGMRVCGFKANLTFTGTSTSMSTSTTGTMAAPAANLTVVPTCGPPFATFIGGQVTVTGLDFYLS